MSALEVLAWSIFGLVIWQLIGAIVLTAIDKDNRIYTWACKAPYGLDAFILLFWPLVVWAYFRKG